MTTSQDEYLIHRILESRLQALIRESAEFGYVVTVHTLPMYPLAMGNYVMQGCVRPGPAMRKAQARRAEADKRRAAQHLESEAAMNARG